MKTLIEFAVEHRWFRWSGWLVLVLQFVLGGMGLTLPAILCLVYVFVWGIAVGGYLLRDDEPRPQLKPPWETHEKID